MQALGHAFYITFESQQIKVQAYTLNRRTVYQVMLPTPVIITKADNIDGNLFWTSIPQGQQKHAAQLGELIDNRRGDKQPEQQTLF